MSSPTSARRFSIDSFAFGMVLGALFMQLWSVNFSSLPSLSTLSQTTNASSTPTQQVHQQTSSDSGAVSVINQSAGSSVTIESVTVPPPGVWVAVREVNGSQLGNVLGAAYVSGPRTNVSVPLLRATDPNTQYAVELYRDDGTHSFKTTDSVYVDFSTSEPVIAYFSTTK